MGDAPFAPYYGQIDEFVGVQGLHAPKILIGTLMKGKEM